MDVSLFVSDPSSPECPNGYCLSTSAATDDGSRLPFVAIGDDGRDDADANDGGLAENDASPEIAAVDQCAIRLADFFHEVGADGGRYCDEPNAAAARRVERAERRMMSDVINEI